MTRTECGACGGGDLRVFLDLGQTPLANTFPASPDTVETFYPLQLARCGNCGLVQQMTVVPDELIYGEEYRFYSGGSAAQRAYHAHGAMLLHRNHLTRIDRGVVEIACNDGSLLRHFVDGHRRVLGIDPAAPAQAAINDGLPVLREPFTAALGSKLRDEAGPFGLIIAYNSMAHIADLSDVLTGIWALMDDRSAAVIEVQYLPDLIAGNLIGQVYHEHRYFHSLTSFKHAAELHQLVVIDAELIELQGGGLRVTLGRLGSEHVVSSRVARILTSERWLNRDATYDGMQGRVDRNRDHLLDLVAAEQADGRTVVGYAAAAKATTILNYCGFGPDTIPYVADTTPQKWGRYVPGTRIPIVRFDSNQVATADTRLLLTGNYLPHLLRKAPAFLAGGGRWIVAEPTPMVI